MSQEKFDSNRYRNKKTIYVSLPNNPGVHTIWDWSEKRKKYCKRTLGNKFYAVKRDLGKQKTKCFSRLTEAKEWISQTNQMVQAEEISMKFYDLTLKFFRKKKSELRVSTYDTYKSKALHLKYFNKMRVDEITPRVIDQWLEFVKRPNYLKGQHGSRMTYRHELALLQQILDYYAEYICDGVSYSIPVKKRHRQDAVVNKTAYALSKANNKQKFLPRKVVNNFLVDLRIKSEKKWRARPFFFLAYFQFATGTRIGEAAAMDWSDINFDTRTAYIHRNVCWSRRKGRKTFVSGLTKTGENRNVFIPNEVIVELRKWCLRSGRSKGLVFSYDGKTPLPFRSIQYYYDKALEAVGAEWRGTHIMRHSFATDFLEKTKNPKALQGLLGHATASQTNHYAKITENLIQDGMDRFEESFECLAKVVEIKSC